MNTQPASLRLERVGERVVVRAHPALAPDALVGELFAFALAADDGALVVVVRVAFLRADAFQERARLTAADGERVGELFRAAIQTGRDGVGFGKQPPL